MKQIIQKALNKLVGKNRVTYRLETGGICLYDIRNREQVDILIGYLVEEADKAIQSATEKELSVKRIRWVNQYDRINNPDRAIGHLVIVAEGFSDDKNESGSTITKLIE